MKIYFVNYGRFWILFVVVIVVKICVVFDEEGGVEIEGVWDCLWEEVC